MRVPRPNEIATLSTLPKLKRLRPKFLVRCVLPSDAHPFVGRIYDLSIVSLSFDSYEALSAYPDVKYAIDVNDAISRLVTRVESLNLAGDMLWPAHLPTDFRAFPISRYHWLVAAADVFLMRHISVVDCAILLVNEILEGGLERRKCTLDNLRKKDLPTNIDRVLTRMMEGQMNLRAERNARIHHGEEAPFTQDDITFRTAAGFEHRSNGMVGTDQFGRKIDVERMFREGLVGLQRKFIQSNRTLVRHLDRLYDALWPEFETRFGPRIAAATHGLNANRAHGNVTTSP